MHKESNEAELKERMAEIFKETDKYMDALENGNDLEIWDALRKANRQGITMMGRTAYKELFDQRYGSGASRHFMKENENDPE
ncbi:MAG: hypothetical protein WC802_01440 [Patescibacteria group bacterium]|jgi:hypothetical protein